MSYSLEFPLRHVYPNYEDGITVVVFLSYGDSTVKVTSKLDTGAEYCVFTQDVAKQLGIPLETGLKKTFDTSGGIVETYGHEITISSFGHEYRAFVYFVATPGHRRNLLGRNGWLHHFGVAVFDYDSTLYISPRQ
jgi:predicted aspartyl protease